MICEIFQHDMKNPSLSIKDMKKRHYFFLNPYEDQAFTRCPKCDGKTKVRKFPLVIHIEPRQMFLLNKQCKYCPVCDLIIGDKSDIEHLMAMSFSQVKPEILGNEYLVMGTLDRKDWREGNKNQLDPDEIWKRIYIFKDVLNFKVVPAQWVPKTK
jgi:hypothetical protein